MIRDREAARELVSIAVHDLREPLRAIRASSELLAGTLGNAADETTGRCLRYIQEGVDRMETLIRDIAEYCYGEVRELDLQETDMETVLLEAQRQLSDELKNKEAVLTHDPLPAVTGDFFALATVFRCLIDNSCKFRGKDNPIIHISAKKQGAEWLFSVQDNGLGFDPVYWERIFNPFERLNGKQYPGSGLGLPLARSILEQHGRRIWAESTPGEGSTFWFSLPISA
jgi:light-regulated signal transduction histidine kinase (bacteriophytochrome)